MSWAQVANNTTMNSKNDDTGSVSSTASNDSDVTHNTTNTRYTAMTTGINNTTNSYKQYGMRDVIFDSKQENNVNMIEEELNNYLTYKGLDNQLLVNSTAGDFLELARYTTTEYKKLSQGFRERIDVKRFADNPNCTDYNENHKEKSCSRL